MLGWWLEAGPCFSLAQTTVINVPQHHDDYDDDEVKMVIMILISDHDGGDGNDEENQRHDRDNFDPHRWPL